VNGDGVWSFQMALMGCVGSRAREALLLAAEEAVKVDFSSFITLQLTTPPPIGKRSIVMSVSVSVSVCLFVCPRSYLRNYTSDLR